MLFFAITGITLNHASEIPATPKVSTKNAELPEKLRNQLAEFEKAEGSAPVPVALATWVETTMDLDIARAQAEWNDPELYVSLPRPGGDAWLTADLETGAVKYERTDRGWIAYLNDLHKGRNSGRAWQWFLDVFAVACVVFTITGLFLLQLHAGNRPTTWPMVGLGVVVPVLLALLFIH